jgi:hypothetical protein
MKTVIGAEPFVFKHCHSCGLLLKYYDHNDHVFTL